MKFLQNIFLLILCSFFVMSVSFVPPGNIDMKNFYNYTNGSYVYAANFNQSGNAVLDTRNFTVLNSSLSNVSASINESIHLKLLANYSYWNFTSILYALGLQLQYYANMTNVNSNLSNISAAINQSISIVATQNAWNSTYNGTYDATSVSVTANQAGWNTTYNSTYAGTSADVTANRSSWNSTYNATYDANNASLKAYGDATYATMVNVNSNMSNVSTSINQSITQYNTTMVSYLNGNYYNQSTSDDRYLNGLLQLYFWNTSSSINSSYTVMNETLPDASVTMKNTFTSLNVGEHNLTKRILSSINISLLAAGTYHQHTTFNYTAGTRTVRIHSELYKFNSSSGQETLIGTSVPSDPLVAGTYQDVDWSGTISNDTTFYTGDYLVMRLNATVSGGGSDATFTLIIGDATGARLQLGINPTDISVAEADRWDDLDTPSDISFAVDCLSDTFQTGGNVSTRTCASVANLINNLNAMLYNIINVSILNTTSLVINSVLSCAGTTQTYANGSVFCNSPFVNTSFNPATSNFNLSDKNLTTSYDYKEYWNGTCWVEEGPTSYEATC